MTNTTECTSLVPEVHMQTLMIEAAEPEILLPVKKCIQFEMMKLDGKQVEVPVYVLIHETADEVRKIVSLVTIEETGSMLCYKEGVFVRGGEVKVEALLHKSFHGYECFDPVQTPKKVIAHLKGLTMASKDKFDADLDIINMKNGLYNWRKKTLYKHSPDYLSLIQIPVIYDLAARCPRIETVLKRVLSATDIVKFKEFAGYCLYRHYPIKKVFILLGPGQTGKSYVLDVLRQFVGDENACSVSLTNLANNRFAGSDLFGKLLDVVNEMDSGELLSSDLFKQITGGAKIQSAQRENTSMHLILLILPSSPLPRTSSRKAVMTPPAFGGALKSSYAIMSSLPMNTTRRLWITLTTLKSLADSLMK